MIEEEALKEKITEIQVQLPVDIATFIINEKREFILNIEKRHSVRVLVIANPYLHSPQYNITKIKEDGSNKTKKPSYTLIQQPELEIAHALPATQIDEPAVKSFDQQTFKNQNTLNFLQRLMQKLFGPDTEKSAQTASRQTNNEQTSSQARTSKPNPNSANRRRPPASQQQRRSAVPNRKKPQGQPATQNKPEPKADIKKNPVE